MELAVTIMQSNSTRPAPNTFKELWQELKSMVVVKGVAERAGTTRQAFTDIARRHGALTPGQAQRMATALDELIGDIHAVKSALKRIPKRPD